MIFCLVGGGWGGGGGGGNISDQFLGQVIACRYSQDLTLTRGYLVCLYIHPPSPYKI